MEGHARYKWIEWASKHNRCGNRKPQPPADRSPKGDAPQQVSSPARLTQVHLPTEKTKMEYMAAQMDRQIEGAQLAQEEIYRAGQEPAFPTESAAQTGAKTWRYEGMTLRDYFAAQALPRVIATCANDDSHGMSHADYFAGRAYELADAMLKARQS